MQLPQWEYNLAICAIISAYLLGDCLHEKDPAKSGALFRYIWGTLKHLPHFFVPQVRVERTTYALGVAPKRFYPLYMVV